MTALFVLAGYVLGVITGIGIVCWLLIRSHNAFTAAFHTSPEGK